MTTYYNINTQERSTRPKSATTSNIWLNPDKLLEEGWLPLVDGTHPTLDFGEYYDGDDITHDGTTATRVRTKTKRTLSEQKALLKDDAKQFIESKMNELHGGIAAQIAKRSGDLGAGAQSSYQTDQTTYIDGYQQFVGEVDGASTWAALETVYNDYPQLQE